MAANEETNALLREAVSFHGHLCPGLLIGFRAAQLGLERLGVERSEDEELVAIVENDSCSVDGIQFLTGCTFGKGNFFFRDWGKQVFTLAKRGDETGVRLSFLRDRVAKRLGEGADRNAFIRALMEAPAEELFEVKEVPLVLPPMAELHASLPCDGCGELVMDTRLARVRGRRLCMDCLLKGDLSATLGDVAHFLFETGMLKKTPRSGYQFLGNGSESVAEHSFRTAVLGFVLAGLAPEADRSRVVYMCLFHDLPEARTGDHNYVNKQYTTVDEPRATADAAANVPCGPEIEALLNEFRAKETLEAKLANDADQLDLAVELKEKQDLGNQYAAEWLTFAEKRIKTQIGRDLFQAIVRTDWAGWWFDREREHLWVGDD